MLQASKLGDPVLGIDIHMVLPPPPAPPTPFPMPHPFVGVVFDPIGAAVGAALGAVFGGGGPVLINHLPCGNTGTDVKGVPHFPMPPGVAFAPCDIPSNDGTLVFGSKTVTMAGSSIARLTDMVMTCNFPINLPTSMCLAVPMGAPVLVGGPPSLDLMAAVTKAIRTKWFSDALHRFTGGRFSKIICFLTGHPVDVMSGEVLTDAAEAELPGPIPLTLERSYYSRSRYAGPLGPGWTHPLDASVTEGLGELILRLPDGRARELPPLAVGASHWDDIERLTLERTAKGYRLHAPDGLRYDFVAVDGARPPRPEGLHPLRADVDHPTHRLARVVDRSDNAVTLRYDDGRLAEVIDSAGRRVEVRWTADRRRWSGLFVDGAPIVRYTYDREGQLAAAADPTGAAMRYAYRGGVLTQETDRNGLSFYFEYDVEAPEGWCTRTWGDGGIYDRRLTYDEARHVTLVDDSRGGRTHYFGNALGLVERVIDPTGVETRYAYDASCRKVAETDGLGNRREWAYDGRGNCTVERDPAGGETQRRYNPLDLPEEIVDAGGGLWTLDYDRRGRLERVVDPVKAEHRYAYGPRGELTAATDPLGRRFTLRYDGGLLAESTDWEGGTTRYGWDGVGRLVEHTDPMGRRVRLQRDGCGRLLALRRDDGTVLERRYDGEGNVTEEVDALGHVTRFRYAGMSRLVAQTDPSGGVVRYAYDTEDELVGVTNEAGEVYTLELDRAGRVTREVGFDGRTLAFRYDRAGRCVETVSGAGRVTRIERDALGRVTKQRVPARGTPDQPVPPPEETEYRYDALGALVYTKNGDAEVTLERDPLGRVLREVVNGRAVESGYDAAGQRTSRRTSEGHAAEYHVDGNGLLRGVTVDVHDGWLRAGPDITRPTRDAWRMTIARDAAGAEVERRLPGEVTATWAHDAAGRPARQQILARGVVSRQRAYTWQDDLRIAAIADSHTGETAYRHDARGHLVAARRADGSVQHRAADAVGNVFRTEDRRDREYARGGVLKRAGEARYVHDVDGQLVEKVTADGRRWRYAWDGAGQLREVQRPDGKAVTFAYDPLGRRVKKSFEGRTTEYVWDGNDLVHELRAEGATTWVFEPGTFAPLAKVEGGQRYGVLCDHLGAPTEMRDEAGALAWRAQLDLYGVANDDVMRGGCPWRWPGQYEDEETGLYYNRFRYYDPEAGRYVSQDPIGLEGGLAQYGYVHDPLAWLDPLGLARGLWQLTRDMADAVRQSGGHSYFRSISDGLWWSKDTAGHGGSAFKVFKEGPGGDLVWYRDADEFGDFIDPNKKHKGPKGKKVCS